MHGGVEMKTLLMAGVSSLALAAAAPTIAKAGDFPEPPTTKAAAAILPPQWTWWVEGGLQGLSGGSSYVSGFNPPFSAPASQWGWNGAAAVDYRFDAVWHISAAFRYGSNRTRRSSSNPVAAFSIPGIIFTGTATTPTAVNVNVPQNIAGTTAADRKEYNWNADFMVGRDIGLGSGNSQLKFGVRVAEIHGKTEGTVFWNVPVSTATTATITHRRSYTQANTFLGAGPRLAVEGNVPLVDEWSIDYMAGVAGLYGSRELEQTVSITSSAGICIAGCISTTLSNFSNTMIFNADAMLGVSYQLTEDMKLSVNYRVDAYVDAMRVVDPTGNFTNTNRIYHGPNLRLTIQY